MRKITNYDQWVQNQWKKGYGQGRFLEYLSWLSQNSFSSRGYTTITARGLTVKRNYLFFSDLEKFAFRIIDFRDETIDILEQVPLIDRDLTGLIAQELRVRHPKNKDNTNIVMTTDLLVFYDDNNEEKRICYTVKKADELENKRVIEKLAIEREYWRRQGVEEYRILTEKDINRTLALNLESLVDFQELKNLPNLENYTPLEREELADAMEMELRQWLGTPRELSKNFENQFALLPGTGIPLIKNLLVTKRIKIDLTRPINYGKKWELL